MCFLKCPTEQCIPLTWFPMSLEIYTGSIGLDSLCHMITCEPLTGSTRKDWGDWLSQSWGLYSRRWEWNKIPWNNMGQAGIEGCCLLFSTCHLYPGEIMPCVSTFCIWLVASPRCYLTGYPVLCDSLMGATERKETCLGSSAAGTDFFL